MQIVTCSDDARYRIWQVGCSFADDNYSVLLRGWAVTPKITHADEENISQVVETIPRASKSRTVWQERTPDPVCSDVIAPETICLNCNGKGQTATPCTTCLCVPRRKFPRTKHRLEDLLDDGASCSFSQHSKYAVLSPVREGNQESTVGLEARRLFSPREHSFSDKSPTSNWQTDTIPSSPTLNLPNYVLDGTSPHHHCSSNPRLKENIDWLTKLRNAKLRKMKTNSGERNNYISAYVTPKRRLTRSRSHEIIKGISPKGNSETLRRFFQVARKSNGETLNYAAAQGENS
jgi:denticleless